MRPLAVFQPTGDVAPDALLSEAETWLSEGARRVGPGTWILPLRLGPFTRSVRIEIGSAISRGNGVWRSVRWEPVSEAGDPLPLERLLPRFAGEIGLVRTDLGSSLVLEGDYEVPLGVVGEAIDAFALKRAARVTGTRLLGEIASRLGTADAVRGACTGR